MYEDIHQVSGSERHLHLVANRMFEYDSQKKHKFKIKMLYTFFLSCDFSPGRTRENSAKRNVVLTAIHDPGLYFDGGQTLTTQNKHPSSVTNVTSNPVFLASMDLSKSIQAMTNIIPLSKTLNGDETKPFSG